MEEINDENILPAPSDIHINVSSGTKLSEVSTDEGNMNNESDSAFHTPRAPSDESKVEPTTPQKVLASPKLSKQITKVIIANKSNVDTAAPIESVKDAVSKFGGITDWNAHKAQALERRKHVQQELLKAQVEIPQYKKQAEAAEAEKALVLEELQNTLRLVEELKLSLEKAETEEVQAKQDSKLAQLRIKEMEQGIACEASVAAKEQFNVAKSRHASAVAELESVKNELKIIKEEYDLQVSERDMSINRAEEAISASKSIEKTVEDLSFELITARETLESVHAAHMEAEAQRISAALARDQDTLNWEKELKLAEDEMMKLNEKVLLIKDLQSKSDTASALLLNLKSELAAYKETKLNQDDESTMEGGNKEDEHIDEAQQTHASMQECVASTKKELEEVKCNTEKAREAVSLLKAEAALLESVLETEKAEISKMMQMESMASITVKSLETELDNIKMEIELVKTKEKDILEKMVDLPNALEKAASEAEEFKLMVQLEEEELRSAKEEADLIRGIKSTLDSKLSATLKDIEATKASEKIALAAIKALQESEITSELNREEPQTTVTIPLEKYYALNKEAHKAEEMANERVSDALSQIEMAKESEAKTLENLDLASKELIETKESLRLATERYVKANEGKLSAEQELRIWQTENGSRRKAKSDASEVTDASRKDSKIHAMGHDAEIVVQAPGSDNKVDRIFCGARTKKKKSLFPRLILYLSRKRTSSSSSSS